MFLLKHHPIRSPAHGEAKLGERARRWNAEERSLGWHLQYDDLGAPRFVRDPATLLRFDDGFFEEHLVERLSGAGVFGEPPPWATPPCGDPTAPRATGYGPQRTRACFS